MSKTSHARPVCRLLRLGLVLSLILCLTTSLLACKVKPRGEVVGGVSVGGHR